MRKSAERVRLAALTSLAAGAGAASAGFAVLVRDGVCLHRLAAGEMQMAGMQMAGMPGMPSAATASDAGPCPALLAATLIAGLVCLYAVVAIALWRPNASGAVCLLAPARTAWAFARRILTALIGAVRPAPPGGAAAWAAARVPVRVSGGVRLARRRGSRAPPSRF